MKYGLSAQELKLIEAIVAKPLAEVGAKLWVFGSRARGDYSRYSDLDLLIDSKEDISRLVEGINEILIESNFPYIVDLVLDSNLDKDYRPFVEKDKTLFHVG